ncbi:MULTISPECIES: argininosuccinate lyase [Brevibacillus]|jgi:argininosuccinate lyase|uniref:argininosuccinate lyase n=1 Tax=Brevibacillus TaxID=55080 RepID=UPI0004680AC2|nr:argininosuccinate lyase [Brevibacillus borstelensis]KKX55524.1 argininosuccinate lyase [Brevibacillus borstelensis cifa_chp40]MCC0564919.1 argininosuccinate lyase [Brevibacillus borstelensis]MCM3469149.1 argininosuccinate lyase [Brevibacillus borstelensis]MCM3560038.1 argininosuccinate lyase [Brevibacillus borstelensis]MCM3589669.1 argininosuccinate lyase [Brevibacillus borstelensis]
MKLWGGRFTKPTDKLVEEFTASIGFDQKMAADDIRGSLAHVKMLGACGIIPQEDADTISEGLRGILQDVREGRFVFSVENEDVHMNIEKSLIERIGPVGGKLHTGRSRNDQVATDIHLYLRRETKQIIALVTELLQALTDSAREHQDVIIPGYTHLQRAQPVLLAHHLLAYFGMFARDAERLQDALKRIDILPLGAGALAGTTFPIDRELVAKELGFARMYDNSMDAVSDRDFVLEFLGASSILMMHLSRFCEEMVLWSSTEFGFVELDDAYCTGSSIMPQKKNPDVAELLRGKTGRVYGNLFGLLTVLKGLPLTYNKDLQEDKEGMFDTVETVKGALALFAGMVRTMEVRRERLAQAVKEDFSNATDLADYLVRKGMPFRQAHEVIGKLVLYCITQGKFLADLTLEEYQEHSPHFEQDVYAAIDVRTVVDARDVFGGTGSKRVQAAIERADKAISELKDWVDEAMKVEPLD